MSNTDYSDYMEPGTRQLTGVNGGRFRFDPGSFCLELLLTGGPGPYQRYEILRTPADFANWLVDSRLSKIAPIEDVRVRLSELRQIKELRDLMWSVARSVAHGGMVEEREADLINACASTSMRPELDPVTGVRRWAEPITGFQILGAAARDAIDLVGAHSNRVRECQAPDCYLLFLDTSRAGNRRWCSMRTCGNRSKVKAYRGRQE